MDGDGTPETSNTNFLQTPNFSSGTSTWLREWNYYTRQDYRGIMPLHVGVANCLMADGSVQQLVDQNGDQYINNGFDLPTSGRVYWTSAKQEVEDRRLANFHTLQSRGPNG